MASSGRSSEGATNIRPVRPAQIVFLGFLLVQCAGTALLMLPAASASGRGADLITALFTATSALCVTGLVVVDTPVYWSGFGQGIILLLIQVGGLGVMTFATVIGLAVLRRLSLRSKLVAATEAKSAGLENLRSLVLGILGISLAVEAVLAAVLAFRFALRYAYPAGRRSGWVRSMRCPHSTTPASPCSATA